MIPKELSKGGLLIIGFLIMAACSTIFTLKQAMVIDAMGDVASVRAEISELRLEAREADDADKNKDEIKELQEEELPAQSLDAQEALASLPNGAVVLTMIFQLGAAAFGLGILAIFLKDDENERVRAVALIVIGVGALTFIMGRTVYLVVSAAGGGAGSF